MLSTVKTPAEIIQALINEFGEPVARQMADFCLKTFDNEADATVLNRWQQVVAELKAGMR